MVWSAVVSVHGAFEPSTDVEKCAAIDEAGGVVFRDGDHWSVALSIVADCAPAAERRAAVCLAAVDVDGVRVKPATVALNGMVRRMPAA